MRTNFSQTHQVLDVEEFFPPQHNHVSQYSFGTLSSTSNHLQNKSSHYFITMDHPSFSQDDFSSSLPLCISAFIAFFLSGEDSSEERGCTLE